MMHSLFEDTETLEKEHRYNFAPNNGSVCEWLKQPPC